MPRAHENGLASACPDNEAKKLGDLTEYSSKYGVAL